MNITPVAASELTDQQLTTWSQLQQDDPTLGNPFFRPEFTLAVAAVRDHVEVAVLHNGGGPVGFFPYYRDRGDVAQPVARHMSDYQGAIVKDGIGWDPKIMLRSCGLTACHFNQLLASQQAFQPYHWTTGASPYMDLSQGFEAYRIERRKSGTDEIQHTLRKVRKAQREIGPVYLDLYCDDQNVLNTLIDWKSQQLAHMKVWNGLVVDWVGALLNNLIHQRGELFSGMLSALYLGDSLAAIAMNLHSAKVIHGWITAFDRQFSRYSPGLILLTELCQHAESMGVEQIDMGQGPETYKRSFCSGKVPLAEGSVDLRPVTRTLRHNWLRAREWVRTTPLGRPAKTLVERIRYSLK